LIVSGWSALILAGGAGRRFLGDGGHGNGDGSKLLADFCGAPLIRRVAERVIAGNFAEVLVVTGAEDAAVRTALAGLECRILAAPGWAEGMAMTLRTGIAALAAGSRGVCIFLGDMPLVPVGLCAGLVKGARRTGYAARPRCGGIPGHPVALTRAAFADVTALTGDTGAAALFKARPEAVAYLDTADRGVLLDIDTAEDLAAAGSAWNACATSATTDSASSRGALPKP
jgi:molybdenum cofactor cytidylyltransferase